MQVFFTTGEFEPRLGLFTRGLGLGHACSGEMVEQGAQLSGCASRAARRRATAFRRFHDVQPQRQSPRSTRAVMTRASPHAKTCPAVPPAFAAMTAGGTDDPDDRRSSVGNPAPLAGLPDDPPGVLFSRAIRGNRFQRRQLSPRPRRTARAASCRR